MVQRLKLPGTPHFRASRFIFITSAFLIGLAACQEPEMPVQKEEIALDQVPTAVIEAVRAANPSFTIQEVIRKTTNKGNIYYDVEGEIASGEELEYDILMTGDLAEIVETQRDIPFDVLPPDVAMIARNATEGLQPVRIIESLQTDGRIVYEFFTKPDQSAPAFEILSDGTQSTLLDERWRH